MMVHHMSKLHVIIPERMEDEINILIARAIAAGVATDDDILRLNQQLKEHIAHVGNLDGVQIVKKAKKKNV